MEHGHATTLTPAGVPTGPTGPIRELGAEELALLGEVIELGKLSYSRGGQVTAFERDIAARLGMTYARAVTSGAAAIHAAVAAVRPEPGDEIITTPVTDMRMIAPILYQQAIPVFADVDPASLNITAETVAARISPRTRAIIATHLFGNPCDVVGIQRLGARHGIPVIEDATQAFLATQGGRLVGTIGTLGAFSLRHGDADETSAEDGGMVVTDDPERARWMTPLSDRVWGYADAEPDRYFVALDDRMTDLQGALARVQLGKLAERVARRRRRALQLGERLAGVTGVTVPAPLANATHVFSSYPLIVDPAVVTGGADALGARLQERGVACLPRYIQTPVFECGVLRDRRIYGTSGCPYAYRERQDGTSFRYDIAEYPGTVRGLMRVLVLPWSDARSEADVDRIAAAVRASV